MMAEKYRTESDSLGSKLIEANAYYGIHSLRAKENFPDTSAFNKEWYKAVGVVKQACYQVCKSFRKATLAKYPDTELPFKLIDEKIINVLEKAAIEISEGKHFEQFIVPAVSGGAGTSINMNVNEIIANVALLNLGYDLGNYEKIDPIEDANVFQSTNDVIPTSLKIATLRLLSDLEKQINDLRQSVEHCENKYRNELRVAYTQMQEAVPSSYGKLFGSYSEAFSRDWWRVSKCFERIKVVNMGGSAVGTGLAVPRFFVMEIVPVLQRLTGLPITRSENLPDATQNLDSFVEVHAILKSHAVNLEKIVSDIRLLASDIHERHGVGIPQKQVGSSIMPGKVNPVIPEFVISVAHMVYSNDILISSLCAQGCLDLNAYLPVIGNALLGSLKLLVAADKTLRENLFDGLVIKEGTGIESLLRSPAITTALGPYIGYHKASLLSREMKKNECDIFEANRKLKMLDESKLIRILKPENLLKTGFSIGDIIDQE
jgi:aspartate ammonia-lyase